MSIDVLFPPLTDADGHTYRWVPCQADPPRWDHDATTEQQARSAELCRTWCPAIHECLKRAAELGPRAEGVWGGQIFTACDTVLEDPQVLLWAVDTALEFPGYAFTEELDDSVL